MNRNPRTSAVVAILALGFCAQAGGQSTRKLEFEVASVKPTALDQDSMREYSRSGSLKLGARIVGKRAEYLYMSLRRLVAAAYSVEPFQVACPDWLREPRFDVVGIMPEGSRKEEVPAMLQALLAERFRLAVHHESRQEAVTALVVAEGGPRLKESDAEAAPSGKADFSKNSSARFFTSGTVGILLTANAGGQSVHIRASRMTMADLAHLLTQSDLSDRPIVDMTGLKGSYDVELDIPLSPADLAGASDAGLPDVSDPGSGGVFRTLKSLGLELKKRKAPVDYVVVDHADKQPTGN